MMAPTQAVAQQRAHGDLNKHAVGLFSQQIWCWGRDILRPEGNWLIEIGFDRIEPPEDREECSSVYSLELPQGRCIVLRGFGVFYGDLYHGGVFLPRYDFRPKYTPQATLETPPWSDADLPSLNPPTDSTQASCVILTSDLIDWIRDYEMNIVKMLGADYRRATLLDWENGKRLTVPAEEMASAWQQLGVSISEECGAGMKPSRVKRDRTHA